MDGFIRTAAIKAGHEHRSGIWRRGRPHSADWSDGQSGLERPEHRRPTSARRVVIAINLHHLYFVITERAAANRPPSTHPIILCP